MKWIAIVLLLALAACERTAGATSAPAASAAEAAVAATTAVAAPPPDSAPSSDMEAALGRFRQMIGHAPLRLGGAAASSRAALVERFIRAVETADTAAFATMMISRAEFAWLYYPHTNYMRPPYEMDPAVLWTLQVQNAEKGINRTLREYGGKPLGLAGHRCAAEPATAGPNRVWQDCVIDLDFDGETVTLRLFGSILERDGRFKFMSYANNL